LNYNKDSASRLVEVVDYHVPDKKWSWLYLRAYPPINGAVRKPPEVWMNLQSHFDLAEAERKRKKAS
jgi:hypothetical protein